MGEELRISVNLSDVPCIVLNFISQYKRLYPILWLILKGNDGAGYVDAEKKVKGLDTD